MGNNVVCEENIGENRIKRKQVLQIGVAIGHYPTVGLLKIKGREKNAKIFNDNRTVSWDE